MKEDKYKIVSGTGLYELQVYVNSEIECGYDPIGSIQYIGSIYFQSLYKK